MKVEPNHEAGMNIPSFGQQNISPSTLPIQGELVYYAMFGQKREDGMQTSPADGSSSNEPASYSNTQPKFEIKNNLTALALNCSHAAATAMNKLSIPQLESWYQRVSMLVQKSPPELHGDSTQLNNGTHEYSVPSPEFMYQFRGHSDLYVGWEDKVRPDQIYIDRWEHKVLPRLWTDIREFEKKMRRSSRIVRGRPGLSISPELRMSGRVEASHKVKLLPRIWILYGHERWRRSVLKFVSELEWLSLEGFGEVEVHLGSVKLSALESSSVLPGLDFNEDHMYCLDDQTKLYLHVEQPQRDSACGLVCCATVFRGGVMMSQRFSRIGGILRVNNELFGVTTAHGMLEWFLNALPESEVDSVTFGDESLDYPLPSDDEDEEVPSTQFRKMDTAIEHAIHINRVHQWSRVSVGLTSFLQTSYYCQPGRSPIIQKTGVEEVRGHIVSWEAALCSDFSLWGLQNAEGLQNAYTNKDGQRAIVDTLASCQDAKEGPVQLLIGIDGISNGYLLPGTMSFLAHGTQFKTRKIRTTEPLGLGCSGTWVVRDRQLQGIVIASYDYEPYVHMIATDDLLSDIKMTIPVGSDIQLPKDEPIASKTKILNFLDFKAVPKRRERRLIVHMLFSIASLLVVVWSMLCVPERVTQRSLQPYQLQYIILGSGLIVVISMFPVYYAVRSTIVV